MVILLECCPFNSVHPYHVFVHVFVERRVGDGAAPGLGVLWVPTWGCKTYLKSSKIAALRAFWDLTLGRSWNDTFTVYLREFEFMDSPNQLGCRMSGCPLLL